MDNKFTAFIERNRRQIILTVLALLVLAVYWQTTGHEFINFDDNIYVYENPAVAGGLTRENVIWAFTQFHSANWHPLTWMSHQLDVSMFGLRAGSHHATNVFLHLVNSILAFFVFAKLTGSEWKSAILAALFAVHPAHVESVAWVAERKDVLSTMFWLLSMWAYIAFAQRRMASKGSALFYIGSILLFALGLMAKPMLVTLPFVFLLLDFWSLERLKKLGDLPRLILEKLPFFVLAGISSYITILAQRSGGAVMSLERLPLYERSANAAVAYVQYLIMLVYPVDLSVWCPYAKNISPVEIAGALIVLLGITAFCVWQMNRRKYLLMGWLWFVGTLVPVIGIVQVGVQSHADRYTYVPYFGLFIMIVWGVSELFSDRVKIPSMIAAAAIAIFAVLSFNQTALWKNNETLYRHSIAVTDGNYLLMQNLCFDLTLKERLDEAEIQCRNAIDANPEYAESYNSLGIIQIKRRQYPDAEQNFRKAITARPDFGMYRVNLAIALTNLGKPAEAEESMKAAAATVSYRENQEIWISAIKGLATAYAAENNLSKAEENLNRALNISPRDLEIRKSLAAVLLAQNKLETAEREIKTVLSLDPNLAEAHNLYGVILMNQQRSKEAISEFEKALQIEPNSITAQENLKALKDGTKK